MRPDYQANSISLVGGVAMGTGVMIGAGIFALTGQIAELAGRWFPLSFIAGGIVTAFSAYTYVKMSNAFPSAGGIAVILPEPHGSVQFRPTSRFSAGACGRCADIIIPELEEMLAEAKGVRLHEPSRRERCGASALLSIVAGCERGNQ